MATPKYHTYEQAGQWCKEHCHNNKESEMVNDDYPGFSIVGYDPKTGIAVKTEGLILYNDNGFPISPVDNPQLTMSTKWRKITQADRRGRNDI